MIHVDDALWFLMEKDPSLNPYAGEIRMHLDRFNDRRWQLNIALFKKNRGGCSSWTLPISGSLF